MCDFFHPALYIYPGRCTTLDDTLFHQQYLGHIIEHCSTLISLDSDVYCNVHVSATQHGTAMQVSGHPAFADKK